MGDPSTVANPLQDETTKYQLYVDVLDFFFSRLQEEKTKLSEAPSPRNPSKPTTTPANSVKEVQLPNTTKANNKSTDPAASIANIPPPSKPSGELGAPISFIKILTIIKSHEELAALR